ncbi:hypothetical protein [Nocardioides bruguierae]|uniref:Uncharacterized protein n=1 Tax=Nocardioides bruguierae TaxID=2945102 RepID=A0A9X2DA39_9ACTN|nr:hypothetical protein [Nocardioides bruguierae]MCM0622107.1 hypothetical protein [Nocardioides bruguierae]
MTGEWGVPAWAAVAVLVLLALLAAAVVVLDAGLRRVRREAASEAAVLRERLSALERTARPTATPSRPAEEFVITELGSEPGHARPAGAAADEAPTVPAPLFADLVLRETTVQAGALLAGVRRALDPETRARVRVAMRQELRRSRKQRRVETRLARRAWAARQRQQPDAAERVA